MNIESSILIRFDKVFWRITVDPLENININAKKNPTKVSSPSLLSLKGFASSKQPIRETIRHITFTRVNLSFKKNTAMKEVMIGLKEYIVEHVVILKYLLANISVMKLMNELVHLKNNTFLCSVTFDIVSETDDIDRSLYPDIIIIGMTW